jgi:hypothetical protein
MRKTIYITDRDASLWQRAEAFARVRRLSMSALILLAIEDYLSRNEGQPHRKDPW